MSQSRARGMVLACGMALVLLGMPSSSEACQALDWIWPWNWCRGPASTTTFAPAYTAPVCNPCATQTCSYVPQTAYRSVLRTVPMTTCRPVTCCDPCTGCPVTTYRPITSYVRTTQLIPYTTYRRVWSNPCVPCAPCVSCDPCGTACGISCGTSCESVSTVGGGCASCAAPNSTPSYLSPTAPALPRNGAPPPQQNGAGAPSTFKSEKPVAEPPITPIPDAEIQQNSLKRPRLIDPENRTTARPIQHAGYFRPVSHEVAPARKPIDYGGWRASRD